MDAMQSADEAALKRKRTLSNTAIPISAPPPKAARVAGNQLSINYLARSSTEDLPLIQRDETLPNLLQLLSLYSGVLDRHESLASNLGARPLGPILIKRFERCFDAPPKVVASHHRNPSIIEDTSHQITWLEVIEFARSHPTQFTLGTFSEGRRVCQFYHPQRQLRVQISEEDFIFIKSGRCQELIPPLPIWEDEEKEVTTCDVLDARLRELTNAADMVAARTRQLSHRLKGRRAAILERRAEGGSSTPARVNVQHFAAPHQSAPSTSMPSYPNGENGSSVRHELLRHFESLPQNQAPQQQNRPQVRPSAELDAVHGFRSYESVPPEQQHFNHTQQPSSVSPRAISPSQQDQAQRQSVSNASTKHNFSRPLAPALESSQPFRPLCQAHMDSLARGTRVLPPCDRCRRLRMDCVKNLTSCAGCTRKHARCHWREVSRDELGALGHLMDSAYATRSPAPSDSNGDRESHDSEDELDDDSESAGLVPHGNKSYQEQIAEMDLAARATSSAVVPADPPPANVTHGAAPDRAAAAPTSAVVADVSTTPAAVPMQERQPVSVTQLAQPTTSSAPPQAPVPPPTTEVGPSVYDTTTTISATPAQAGMSDAAAGFRAVNSMLPSATVEQS